MVVVTLKLMATHNYPLKVIPSPLAKRQVQGCGFQGSRVLGLLHRTPPHPCSSTL
jgi:hypothetical protein